ncbi:universal stress protein [Agriterribacter sp.]|uniref:universal stress protein n=1 Tax=Agriterribacter sp. TaxID=2821509 RepID=UPI002CE9689B|nr:universal stress protein [Agriterribacter sp.]HRP56650.1 universal stress protein [Agriterribacter sp.]
MQNKLYNILVPVDFTAKNKWAIAKAIEMANNFNCNIHLVHVVFKPVFPFFPIDASRFTPYASHINMQACREKLTRLKAAYKNQLCGEGEIEISLLQGQPQEQLRQYIELYNMDMVVLGLSKFNLLQRIISSISISMLARKTNIPILAVRSGGLVSHFKKIVLPLYNDIPVERIKLATMLARSFRSTVYLVSLRSHLSNGKNIADKTLELVQSVSTIPVQCFLLEGKNLAKSTLDFSKRINADLILGQSIKESRLPGLWNRITNKLLSYASKIPVLTFDKTTEQA